MASYLSLKGHYVYVAPFSRRKLQDGNMAQKDKEKNEFCDFFVNITLQNGIIT